MRGQPNVVFTVLTQKHYISGRMDIDLEQLRDGRRQINVEYALCTYAYSSIRLRKKCKIKQTIKREIIALLLMYKMFHVNFKIIIKFA